MSTFPSMMMRPRGGPTLTATVSGNASGSITGAGVVYTNSVSVVPNGGLAPFTYSWTYVSGDGFNVSAPSANTTYFYVSLGNQGTARATYRCTVTSSDGQTVSVVVSVAADSIYQPFSASLTHSSINYVGHYNGGLPHETFYTPFVYVNASGGSGGYYYTWILQAGDPITCTGGQAAQFYAGIGANGVTRWCDFECWVSDGSETIRAGAVRVTISTV